MIKYIDWVATQDNEFKEEIALSVKDKRFIDRNFKPITLEQLKELDNKYCEDNT